MTIKNDAQELWGTLQTQMPPEIVNDIEAGWRGIVAGDTQKRSLKVGQHAPDFSLPSATGKLVRLTERLGHGPVVLTFYRGIWCPFCNLSLQTYQRALPEITARGATLIAVSPQTPDNTLNMKQKNALEFDVLSDAGCRVAAQYGLAYKAPATHLEVLEKFDMALTKVNGDDSGLLPLPATYVIDRSGRIVWAHIDPNYRTRGEVDEMLAALDRQESRNVTA